jgi:hypothetical protein
MHGTAAVSRKKPTLAKFGSEGKFQIGQRIVADPLEVGARMTASVNVRESAIDHMASRGRINTAQEAAGQRFRKLWELAAIGRKQGIDPEKEFVDGGAFTDPISDDLVKASMELNRVMAVVGQAGANLLISIVGEGARIEEVAQNWSKAGGIVMGRRAEGYVTGRMIEALDDLVRHWGLESKERHTPVEQFYKRNGVKIPVISRPILKSHAGHTGPVVEIEVGRFGDVVERKRRKTALRHGQQSGTA